MIRLCPRLDYRALLDEVHADARKRRARVLRLRNLSRDMVYRPSARAVARAVLRELDPGWLA